ASGIPFFIDELVRAGRVGRRENRAITTINVYSIALPTAPARVPIGSAPRPTTTRNESVDAKVTAKYCLVCPIACNAVTKRAPWATSTGERDRIDMVSDSLTYDRPSTMSSAVGEIAASGAPIGRAERLISLKAKYTRAHTSSMLC